MVDRRLLSLFSSTTLFCLTLGVMAPFLPLIAEDKRLAQWKTGLIFALMPVASLIASPFVGTWLYLLGRRSGLFLGFLLDVRTTQSLAMLLAALSVHCDAGAFFALNSAARVLSGCCSALVFTITNSVIASDYQESVFQFIGINESCASLGVMLGPLAGTALFVAAGYQGIYYGMASIFLLGGAAVYWTLGPDREYRVEEEPTGVFSLLRRPKIAATLLPLAFAMTAIGAQDVFMSPHFESFRVSPLWIGLLFGLGDCGYLVTSVLFSLTLSRASKQKLNVASTLIAIFAILLTGPYPDFLPNSLFLVIFGFILSPIGLSIVFIEAVPSLLQVATEDYGIPSDDFLTDQLSALENIGASVGEIVGPVAAGYLIPVIGVPQTCGILALLGFLAVVLYIGTMAFAGNARNSKAKERLL